MLSQDSTILKINMILFRMSKDSLSEILKISRACLAYKINNKTFTVKEMIFIRDYCFGFPFISSTHTQNRQRK